MKNADGLPGVKVALWSLLVGALGAPIFHVAEGIIAPQGFLSLRGDSLAATPFVFLIAWLWSLLATFILGGVAWVPLHKARLDGFLSYVLVAVIAGFVISFTLTSQFPSRDLLLMSAANGLITRLSELRFRTIEGNPRSSKEAR